MNWGKGIIIGMSLFMGFIIFLVVNLMMHRVDLESEDYYKKEINYEQDIIARTNAEGLTKKIELKKQKDFVIIQVPDSSNFQNIEVYFMRPNNRKSDKHFLVKGTKTFLIPYSDLESGHYNVEIRFQLDSKNYLLSQSIYL